MKTKIKREKSTSTKGHYVRNADLLPAVIAAKEKGVVTSELIKLIKLIAERYSRKGNFVNYSFREDMVSAAVENLCKNALKFDHIKYSNPFSFYTTAIHNSFLQFMADEKKHRNIRDALLIDAGANPSFNFLQQEKDESVEIKDSDDLELVIPKAADDGTEKPAVETATTDDEPEVKTEKIRYRDRIPGPVLKLSAGDFVLDPVTNTYVRKQVTVEPPAEVKVRKTRAKKVDIEISLPAKPVKEKATAVKKNQKAPAAIKKVAVKKAPAKKVVVAKSKPVTTTQTKPKEAAKKPAAKKVAAPRKAAVKTTSKNSK